MSLRTSDIHIAIKRKKLLSIMKDGELFKFKDGDYELVFEYDTMEELKEYLELVKFDKQTKENKLERYNTVSYSVDHPPKRQNEELTFYDLELKFVDYQRKRDENNNNKKISETTYKAWRTTFGKLEKYFHKRPVCQIGITAYDEFADDMIKKDLDTKTINAHIMYSNIFLKYAKKYNFIDENPLVEFDYFQATKKIKENFTISEINNILNSSDIDYKHHLFMKIAIYSGMRLSEINSITQDSIKEIDNIYCFVIKASKTNSGIRAVPIHSIILDEIINCNFPIFDKTVNAVQKSLSNRLKKLFDKEKHPTKSFHTFRANFIEQGVNNFPKSLSLVQDVVGHSKDDVSKLTVDIYIQKDTVQS